MSRSCGKERKTDCSTKLSSLLVLRPHKTLSSSNSPFVASGPREGQSLSLRIDNRMCLSHLPPSPNQNPILVLKSSNLRSPLSPLSSTEDEAEEEANNQSDCFSSIQSFLQRQGSTSILLPDNLPVGGRLQKFWTVWKDLELDPWAVSVVRYGYLLVFSVDPPLSRIPLVQSASSNPTKNLILSQQFQLLLDKGAIEVVHNPQSPGFYSRLFVVPKPNGEWRPVIDLSALNRFLLIPKFKMDTPRNIWKSLQSDTWVFSLDLKDAYFQIPIHKSSRRFLRMEFQGIVYQFKALPFGISTAPWVFTKVVSVVKSMFHLDKMSLFQYLDDWLGDAPDQKSARLRSDLLVQICSKLGFLINWEKSDLNPTQNFEFVGMHFDLLLGRVSITPKNLQKVLQMVQEFVALESATALQWQSLIGTVGAQAILLPFGRLRVRPLQFFLKDRWNQAKDPQNLLIPVPKHIKDLLRWWSHPTNLNQGVPLKDPPFTHRIFTDASLKGWGAHWENSQTQGLWSLMESNLHINILEMRAVRLALQSFSFPVGSSILVATDNTTVVAYINHQGGTRSKSLWLECQSLFRLIESNQWFLKARHIPGSLNVLADELSRKGQILPSEWMLHPDIVRSVFAIWDTPNVDLFATRFNSQCPTFVSPAPDPSAIDVDALSISWEGMNAYAYPPHQIMTQVLTKVRETKSLSLILIAPMWPKQLWYPLLLQLADPNPIKLPTWTKMLRQPRSDRYHQNPSLLNLHAWRLRKSL